MKPKCGRFFHNRCVQDSFTNYELRRVQNHRKEEDEYEDRIICPSHFCNCCYEVYGYGQKQILHKCIRYAIIHTLV